MQRLRGRTDILYYMQRGRGSWLWARWALDQAVCYGPCYFGLSRMVAEEVEGSKLWWYHCLKKKIKKSIVPTSHCCSWGPPLCTSISLLTDVLKSFLSSTHSFFNPLQTDCYLHTPDCFLEINSCLSVMYRHLFSLMPLLCKSSLLADAPSPLSSDVWGTVSVFLFWLLPVPQWVSSLCMCFVNHVDVPFLPRPSYFSFSLFLSSLYFPKHWLSHFTSVQSTGDKRHRHLWQGLGCKHAYMLSMSINNFSVTSDVRKQSRAY